jgi:23S rRNA (guanosine2251-2'-O)-methyltransferase
MAMRSRRNARRDARHTGASDHTIIYGWHSALAAIKNPRRQIEKLLVTRNAWQRLSELGIPSLPEPADPRDIDRVTGAGAVHQGIAVLARPLPEPELDDLTEAKLIVVLDQVTDPHNVGAVIRSAAAFGAEALVLTERHGPADSGVLAKAASGGLEHVALVRVKNLARAMDQLGDMAFLRLGLDSAFADPIESVGGADKKAIVLGAEGRGLRRLTREKCDRLVRLDVPGLISSLNISNAAAVALYALTRNRT